MTFKERMMRVEARKDLSTFMLSLDEGRVDVTHASCLVTALLNRTFSMEQRWSMLLVLKDILHNSGLVSPNAFNEKRDYYRTNLKALDNSLKATFSKNSVLTFALHLLLDKIHRYASLPDFTYDTMLEIFDAFMGCAFACISEEEFDNYMRSYELFLRNYDVMLREDLAYRHTEQYETICAFSYKWELMKI